MSEVRQSWTIRRRTTNVLIVGALSIVSCLAYGGCKDRYKPFLISNENSLFKAAAQGDTSEVKRLLDQGTNSDAREEENETPLMYAAAEGRSEVVNILIDRGASINAVSSNGETA
jgi:ankyrin repeat protein